MTDCFTIFTYEYHKGRVFDEMLKNASKLSLTAVAQV